MDLSPPEPAEHGNARIILSTHNTKLPLLLLSRRSDGSARAHATVDVLLFLLGRLQNLLQHLGQSEGV
jgi:hypothetical protein